MTLEQLAQQVALLTAENAKLKEAAAKPRKQGELHLKVSQKGAVSVYGMGRWPVTLYKSQMRRFLDAKEQILGFMTENDTLLSVKEEA